MELLSSNLTPISAHSQSIQNSTCINTASHTSKAIMQGFVKPWFYHMQGFVKPWFYHMQGFVKPWFYHMQGFVKPWFYYMQGFIVS